MPDFLESIQADFPEVERYELQSASRYWFAPSRRTFSQILGAGILLVSTAERSAGQRRGRGRSRVQLSERFHLGEDGTVTVLTSKVEVGQGSRTQLTQAAAEELSLPIEKIQLVMADSSVVPDDGGTAGSRTTPSTVPAVRQAAAVLRELLQKAAAERLKCEPEEIRVEDGKFRAESTDASIPFATLFQEIGASLSSDSPEGRAELSPPEQWQVLGNSVPKVDAAAIVAGAAAFPSDTQRPNMLYGKVLRPPSWGAKLTALDAAAAKELPGVTVAHDGDFVGAAAEDSWTATRAIEALAKTAKWSEVVGINDGELYVHLKSTATSSGSGWNGPRVREWGEKPAEASARSISLRFEIPYIQHCPMEPRAAVAEWQNGKLTVWTGTQQPSRVKGELESVFRMGDDKVRVVVPDTGGGFGGKHTGEVAVEAARLAQAAGRPVSLRWTREEEFNWAYFRPAGLIEATADLDDAGGINYWEFANYNSGGSALETPYEIPNGRVAFFPADSPLRQGSYRALASTANTFAREVAMDALAEAAGKSPLEFRLQHLPQGRLRDVLQSVAEKADFAGSFGNSTGESTGIGIACGTEKGAYVAACAEVRVEGSEIRILRITQSFECGAIQNPTNLRAQVVGCIMMGLGGAMMEEIRFAEGTVTNGRFSEYRVPRMSDLPELDIVLLNRTDLPSVGAGETPIIAVAPAIANAVYSAVGKRLTSLPLRLS